jgi:hypothetical protein
VRGLSIAIRQFTLEYVRLSRRVGVYGPTPLPGGDSLGARLAFTAPPAAIEIRADEALVLVSQTENVTNLLAHHEQPSAVVLPADSRRVIVLEIVQPSVLTGDMSVFAALDADARDAEPPVIAIIRITDCTAAVAGRQSVVRD